jgi:hypothetical protein
MSFKLLDVKQRPKDRAQQRAASAQHRARGASGQSSNQEDLVGEMKPQWRPRIELVETFQTVRGNHMYDAWR